MLYKAQINGKVKQINYYLKLLFHYLNIAQCSLILRGVKNMGKNKLIPEDKIKNLFCKYEDFMVMGYGRVEDPYARSVIEAVRQLIIACPLIAQEYDSNGALSDMVSRTDIYKQLLL